MYDTIPNSQSKATLTSDSTLLVAHEMSSASKQKKPPPANFLKLPREICQKILYESFDEACEQDIRFSLNVNLFDHILDIRRPIVHFLPHISKQASIFHSIHDTTRDDMGFVINQVLIAFENGFRQVWMGGHDEYFKKSPRWQTTPGLCWYFDEDEDVLHHRRFQMVQAMREAVGADVSQFSFDVK